MSESKWLVVSDESEAKAKKRRGKLKGEGENPRPSQTSLTSLKAFSAGRMGHPERQSGVEPPHSIKDKDERHQADDKALG